ncbi:MAG: O-antigen ligase family protein, partial [Acidimicrobiales bacterium]
MTAASAPAPARLAVVPIDATTAARGIVVAALLLVMPLTGAAIGRGNIVEPTDTETVIKLAIGFAALMASMILSPPATSGTHIRDRSLPLLCLIGLGVLGLLTAPFAVNVPAALIDSLLLILAVAAIGKLAFDIGTERFLQTLVFTSAGLMVVGAGVARFFEADNSLFPVDSGFGGVDRFSGVFADANTLGQTAAVGVLAALVCWRHYRAGPLLQLAGLGCVGSLLISQSRTAAVALALAVVLALVRSGKGRILLLAGVVIVGIAASTVLTSSDLATGAWTRSGRIEEVTTLTGRTSVWKATVGRVIERPVVGFGAGSSPRTMSEEVQAGRIVWPALHAHNAALQALLTTGLVGLGLLVAAVLAWFASERNRLLDPFVWLVILGTTTEALLNRAPST